MSYTRTPCDTHTQTRVGQGSAECVLCTHTLYVCVGPPCRVQGDDVFPIPGTKRVKYLDENVQSLSVTLTHEEKRELEEIVAPEKVCICVCVCLLSV